MMQLKSTYNRDDFLQFLDENFLTDFKKDVRPASTQGLSSIQKAYSLGRSESLDLQVFEFSFEGSPSKRVTLTKDAFQVMKSSAIFRALAIFHSPNSDDWRLSLMTATPERTEKGKVALSYSNPKRLSFFLGPNAKVNTPTKFILKRERIIDFEDLKSRFSLEVVNKEFYKEISDLFTQLVGGSVYKGKHKEGYEPLLKLPDVLDKSQTSLEFAVRLIGRVIFCWFLREKKSNQSKSLMPNDLLSLEAVKNNPDYYHKVLEPIFFEVLNKPGKSRKDDFAKEPFSSIPYLNGGLFSPHDDDFFSYNEGRQTTNHTMVVIPDEWIRRFFDVLETYNFTIDENTSFDEELSIDPEMLGRIFENLLAEINPETGESARKSTGSYYTPRVIVDYMIDESLLLYLKNQTQIDEEKLRAAISYDLNDDEANLLSEDEKVSIISALEEVKILDPACGSGAFPIGALQKIVFILQQTDPEGHLWFKKQIKNTSPELRRVVEREFAHKNFDYIRKLGIIRENIYGVDIQPIATEIARLRCFLTLVVDERIQEGTENRGIEPLPNLDFKFVTANSLIGLPGSQENSQIGLFEDEAGIRELRELRDMFFNASGTERDLLKLQFVQAQNRMFQRLISEGLRGHAELTSKLTSWEPFSHKPSSWFDPEWMFGIKEGFDLVIANPPYVRADNPDFKDQRDDIRKSGLYETLYEKWDLFLPFIERGLKLLGDEGLLCYITSNSLLTSKFGFRLLDYIQRNDVPQFIDYFSDDTKIFEAGVIPVVFGISKTIISQWVKKTLHDGTFNNITKQENIPLSDFKKLGRSAFKLDSSEYKFTGNTIELGNICYLSVGMVLNADEKVAQGQFKVDDLISPVPTSINIKRYVEAKDIENWAVKRVRYLEWDTKRCPELIRRKTFPELYDRPKLMVGSLTGGIYDDTGLLTHHGIVVFVRFVDLRGVKNKSINGSITKFNSVDRTKLETISEHFELKYLLAILNSKFANKYLNSKRRHRLESYFYPDDFRHLPIADITPDQQQPFINLVEKILELTKADDYLHTPTKQARVKEFEKQIDQMVYKLYGLKEEEIKTVVEQTSVSAATKSILESTQTTELTEQHTIS